MILGTIDVGLCVLNADQGFHLECLGLTGRGALKDWCTWSDFVGTVSAHFQGEELENPWDNSFFLLKNVECSYIWVFKLHKLSYWSNISIGGTSVIEDKTKLQACLRIVSKGFECMQHLSFNTY